MLDGEPRPRGRRHRHGVATNTCAHPDCRQAWLRYLKQRHLDIARGLPRKVDAGPTRTHVASLHAAGWSYRAIAGAAGCSAAFVSRVASGDQDTILRRSADAILTVDPATLPSVPADRAREPNVPKLGSVRRVQALLTLGWSHEAQAAHSGVATHLVVSQRSRWVRRSTHDKIAAMYRDLSTRPGPSQRARDRALALGYLGPMFWDDLDHDPEPDYGLGDPEPGPKVRAADRVDEVVVLRILAGEVLPATRAEREETMRRWKAAGHTEKSLCARMGWKDGRYTKGAA